MAFRMTCRGLLMALLASLALLALIGSTPASAQRLSQLLRGRFRMPAPLFRPPRWRPKTGDGYNPRRKDWNGVVSACKVLGEHEKRIMSFMIRAAFHDALAVDARGCAAGNEGANHAACGGADSSLLLNKEEMVRIENAQENFSRIVSRAVIKIASFYDVSASDVLAVCTCVGIEQLSGGRVKMIGHGAPTLMVGRLDSATAAPENMLASPLATTSEFVDFWSSHNFTAEEAMALMGSHALLNDQGCLVKDTTFCDPYKEPCDNLRMFKWENHFFHDVCTPNVSIEFKSFEETLPPLHTLPPAELEALNKTTWCTYTSDGGRTAALGHLADQLARLAPADFELKAMFDIQWSNNGCERGADWGARSCPHLTTWPYTPNDAFLAQTCTGTADPSELNLEYQAAMRKFLDQREWDAVVPRATIKMMDRYARWSPRSRQMPYRINGWECNMPFEFDPSCSVSTPLERTGVMRAVSCSRCFLGECDPCCRCPNAFGPGGYVLRSGFMFAR